MPSLPAKQRSLPFLFHEADVTSKDCSKCRQSFPLTAFYIRRKATGELFSWCKFCHAEINKANRARRIDEDPDGVREKERASAKAWRDANPELAAATNINSKRQRRAERPEEVRAVERAYWAAHPEEKREKNRRNRARHPETKAASDARYRAANEERLRLKHKEWRDAHPHNRETISAAKTRRRCRLAGAGGSHTRHEWAELKAFYDHTCLMCGRKEPEIKLTKDHVIPVSLGGTDDIDNLQPLCKSCNSRKHDKHVDLRVS